MQTFGPDPLNKDMQPEPPSDLCAHLPLRNPDLGNFLLETKMTQLPLLCTQAASGSFFSRNTYHNRE